MRMRSRLPRNRCCTGKFLKNIIPGQGEMIAGFWMPNRAWEGCDVDDPSARVLANYGDSGV